MPAVTVTLLLPPLEVIAALLSESAYVHSAPLCATVKVCPSIVSVPVRELVVALEIGRASCREILLLLVLVVSHDTLLDALQLQPLPAVTVTLLLPPLEVNDALHAESA